MNTDRNIRPDFITYALLTILLVLLAFAVLTQANPGTRLVGRDYGFYVYIGDQILHGKLPYRDAWESKPPAIFYLNAIALWIGHGSRWGVWIIEFASLFAAGIFSSMSAKRLWGALPALASLIFWLIGLNLTLQGGNLTEEYPLFLHFLCIALFLELVQKPENRFYNLLLGLAFSISFLFRPNNAVIEAVAILILFALQAKRKNWDILFIQIRYIGISMLVPILLTALYFWRKGLFPDLLGASILYNLTYSKTAITTTLPLMAGFKIFGWLAWVTAAGYLIALYYAMKSKHPIYFLLLIGFPLTIFMSDLARRNYSHYFMNWLPFLGLLGGLTIHSLISHLVFIKRSLLWERIALGITILFALISLFISGSVTEYEKAFQRIAKRDSIGIDIRSRTASYVENHTHSNDFVLFWAAFPGENFMSKRASPSASLFYPLYVYSATSKRLSDQFLHDIQSKRPVLIVDMGDHEALSLNAEQRARQIADGFAWEYPPDNLDQFFQFVKENYYVEAKVGDKTIYRIRQP